MQHPNRVLVAYAAPGPSTREIANAVAETLVNAGYAVDVEAARDVESLDAYDAVVIGAALDEGHWPRAARRFVARHRAALATRRIFAFSNTPFEADGAQRTATSAPRLDPTQVELAPLSHAIFGATILSSRYACRPWHEITAWATMLAHGIEDLAQQRAVAYSSGAPERAASAPRHAGNASPAVIGAR